MTNTTEEELQKIINSNKSKNIKIDGKNYWISKKVKEEIRKNHITEGGFLPFLLPLIPGIVAGIAKVGAVAAGAAGIASGVAGAVASSRDAIKKQKEIEILEKKLEPVKEPVKEPVIEEGSGLYLNPYQGNAIHKFIKNNSNVPPEITKKFKNGVKIKIKGDGLYLNPYSATQKFA